MIQEEKICSLADDLIAARLEERRQVDIPFLGSFEPIFHKEYIYNGEGSKQLMPPTISLNYQPSAYILEHKHYTSLDIEPPQNYFSDDFVTNLADLYGYDYKDVKEALEHFSELFIEGLFRGRRVAFLGLGAFYAKEMSRGLLILHFEPFPALMTRLNQPFSVYQPTLLKVDNSFPDLEEHDQKEESKQVLQYVIACAEELEEPVTPQLNNEKREEPSPIKAYEKNDKRLTTPQKKEIEKSKRRPHLWVWLTILAVIIFLAIYLLTRPKKPTIEVAPVVSQVEAFQPIDTTNYAEPEERIEEVVPTVTQPIDTVTIKNGVTLAKLAKQYYGNSFYWVFIYMANHGDINDPDYIPLGKSIVIPPLSWYQLDEDKDKALAEAKAWATVILNKQYTSYEEQRPQVVHEE